MEKEQVSIDEVLQKSNIDIKPFSTNYMLATNLGPDLVENLLPEVKEILDNEEQDDYGERLVGRFIEGKQVQIKNDFEGEYIQRFRKSVEALATAYVEKFFSDVSGGTRSFVGRTEINDMWVNEQHAGDYNPLHNHRTASPAGLSGVFYLTAPDELKNYQQQVGKKSRGNVKKGWLQIVHNANTVPDFSRFTLPGTIVIPPLPGSFVLFPKDTCHQVFPFECEGTRICIAFNVNVWYEQFGVTEWSNFMLNVAKRSAENQQKEKK